MKVKTIMLIGASRPNLPIITMARNIGYKVVVTDINPKAEGLKYGDYNYNISAKDIEGLTRIAFKHKVSCVYSGTDINLSVGVINTVMGIEGFPLIVGLASEYKNIFRELAEEAGMPITKGYIARTKGEALSAFKEMGRCAIIKATNLSSSKGVRKVRSEEEVIAGFNECCNLSDEKEVIIEEYIEGSCHDVNGLVIKEKFYPCGVVDRSFIKHSNYFAQKEITCPTALNKDIQEKMYDAMTRFCEHLKIYTSPVKADFLFDENQLYLLEFGPRFHGEIGFLHMIPGALSIRAMEAYLKYRFSGVLDEKLLEEKIIDRAICRAEIKGSVRSNYDIEKYVISFTNKEPVEIYIK